MLGPQGHSASVQAVGDVMPRRPRSRTTTDGSDACAPELPRRRVPTTTLKFEDQYGAFQRRAARDRWPELGHGCHDDGGQPLPTPYAHYSAINTHSLV